ncbi:MAG: efflux RND transporter periplasmic adaptor subunit [Proteobacteria bacterium]|nr:efflux RND transporter periplasmic adaptor subunit [Pseudomonadota bacterium]HQR03509.1 efflux RND transporter periplasmic adaptor subunit [Rhodocyclaceae bacterium]
MKKLPALAVGALVIGAAAYFHFRQAPAGAPPPVAVPVLAAHAATRDLPVVLSLVGRTEAYETVAMKSRVDGQVLSVPFAEGQHVKKGEVLVRLDPADFQARLRQAEAALTKARSDERRNADLRSKGFISAAQMVDVHTAAEAQAAVVDLARLQLDYTTLRAPFDGIVGARLVYPGTGIKTNDTTLAVVNRVRPLYATFTVPEKYLPALMTARKNKLVAEVTVPGSGKSFTGAVTFLDNGVDRTTGTLQAKVLLANDGEELLPGQYVNVNLVLDTLHDVVVIPSEAIQQGPNGSYAFIVKPDQTVEMRPLRQGPSYQGVTAITQGIARGETVVTDGQLRLTPGAKAQIKTTAAAH